MKYDVWVHLRTTTGYKAQYYGEVIGDLGEIVDALKVLFNPDMVGVLIEPVGVRFEEEDDD